MEQLLKAYYQVLELAKENAFKCVIDINVSECHGDQYFVVWVKRFGDAYSDKSSVSFYSFASEEYDNNIERIIQLIKESTCQK